MAARQAEKAKPQQAVTSNGRRWRERSALSKTEDWPRLRGRGPPGKSPGNSEQLGYNLLIHLDEKFDKFAQEANYRPKLYWMWTSVNYTLIP